MACIALLVSACGSTEVPAKTIKSQLHDFRIVKLAGGLDHPWSFAFLPDGGILISERPGRLRLYRDGKLLGVQPADLLISWREPTRGSYIKWGIGPTEAKASVNYVAYDLSGPGQPG